MARKEIETAMESLGLKVTSEFVPWSRSRNFNPKAKLGERTLNWKMTLECEGRPILTTDYQAGIAHCPSYPKRAHSGFTIHEAESLEFETENGKVSHAVGWGNIGKGPILPDPCDVLYSLVSDASVLDSFAFEEWASEFGYDPDSRKAERVYHACLEIALKLRNGIGDAGFRQLQEATQDY